MPKEGEVKVELGRADALAIKAWLNSYQAPRSLLAVTAPADNGPMVRALLARLTKYVERANASPAITLTRHDASWFAAMVGTGGMFGHRRPRPLPHQIALFCNRCSIAMLRRRGAPKMTGKQMVHSATIERTNGAEGKRSKRRSKARVRDAEAYAEWAGSYEGLGQNLIRSGIPKFD